MRIPLALLVAWLVSLTGAAQAQTAPNKRYQKMAEGVYAALVVPGSNVSANSGFVIGTNGVWVFDALRPYVVKEMLAEIKKLTRLPVKYVLNSHHHYELVMGNSTYTGATIVAHENVRKNLIATPPAAQIERTRASNRRLGLPVSESDEAPPPVRLPNLTYTDRFVFYDGDRELQLIHLGRYHTNADSVLFLPREKILFSGDLLPGMGSTGGQREAYFRDFIRSIDKALALDFEVIVPGRGDRLATKEDLRRFQQYLVGVLAEVQKFIDRGATLEETQAGMKPPAYISPRRLGTPSFKRLWADTINRVYAELTGDKSTYQP